jgi:hypothetical protein
MTTVIYMPNVTVGDCHANRIHVDGNYVNENECGGLQFKHICCKRCS